MIIGGGQVAVVTGAAQGLGYALASELVGKNVSVVLADIDRPQLDRAAETLTAQGGQVLAVPVDVSDPVAVEALAARTGDHFGGVDLLVNNAGIVGGGGPVWETSTEKWNQVIRINLLGVVHGIKAFVPAMVTASHGHVVNTASLSGLTSAPFGSIYGATKHGVVALSENLRQDLDAVGASSVGVSVVCPGFVRTRLTGPLLAETEHDPETRSEQKQTAEWRSFVETARANAIDAEVAAQRILAGIEENRLHILTNGDFLGAARTRAETILAALD